LKYKILSDRVIDSQMSSFT